MPYVEIYQVMWHVFASTLAALTLTAILCLAVLIACEFFQAVGRVQGILDNLRV